MFVTKRSLARRTFLSGIGMAVGLPLLEAMVPAMTALAQTAARPRPRSQPQKTLGTGQRKAIPMPGDAHPAVDVDDDNFKNF